MLFPSSIIYLMRKVPFVKDEYYHIYNRGVDKRSIFGDVFDVMRFYQSMQEFNTVEPIGSIFENRFEHRKDKLGNAIPKFEKLVDIVAYCLNPNHFHLILTPLVENGISEFMRRLGIGHTNYFNIKYKRCGALFQGTFKSIHIDSDSYLRHLSVYINLNYQVHSKSKKLGHSMSKSSWKEYLGAKIEKGKRGEESVVQNGADDICEKSMVLSHFDTATEYEKFAKETLKIIKEKRHRQQVEYFDFEKLLLE